MEIIVDYKIITNPDYGRVDPDQPPTPPTGLRKDVLNAIYEGWQPLGGVSSTTTHYMQAMVKYAQHGDITYPKTRES